MSIITNNQPRPLLRFHDVPPKIARADFDYLKTEDERLDERFVQYKGWWYDVYEFVRVPKESFISGWDGYHDDSFFSGVLVKFDKQDPTYVVMGRYLV